jgi:hypothetical protein
MYVALFSGAGISLASASNVRTSLLILSVAALLCLALKRLCRLAPPRVTRKDRNRTAPSPRFSDRG